MTLQYERVGGSHAPSKDYGSGRECACKGRCGAGCQTLPGEKLGRCARRLGRFTPPQKVGERFLPLCGACLERHIDIGTEFEELMQVPGGKTGHPARYLYGLKEAIYGRGLTVASLSRDYGLSRRSIERVVNLEQRAGPARERKLARILNVSVGELRQRHEA